MANKALLIVSFLCATLGDASHGGEGALLPSSNDLPAQKITTEYGPFSVPAKGEDGGMKSFSIANATKPCDTCVVLSMQANLLYPNGTVANANNGMWLHHAVLVNANRSDVSCPQQPERFFASGNERTIIDLSHGGTRQTGYKVEATDTFQFTAELMNEREEPHGAMVTIDWVYITITSPDVDFATPVWLDITGVCGANGSEVAVPESQSFTFKMDPSWKATISGDILLIASHLHDGGVNLEVKRNDTTICDGIAAYGETPGYVEPMDMDYAHHHEYIDGMMMKHISSITECSTVGQAQLGDTWSIDAHYNLTAYPAMSEGDGEPARVMGIALVYIASHKVASN